MKLIRRPARVGLLPAAALMASLSIPADPVHPEGTVPPVNRISPIPTDADWDRGSKSGRVLVQLNRKADAEILAALDRLGKIHGRIEHCDIVSMTLSGVGRAEVLRLPFVDAVEADQPRYRTAVGTWDRDFLDVTDVEETGSVGDPDPREVPQTGAGVHVAIIDDGLPRNWRDFLPEDRVDTKLARAIMGGGAVLDRRNPGEDFHAAAPKNLWEKDNFGHGMAVASHVIGYRFGTTPVDGIAPEATVIPIKVFSGRITWTSRILGAIDYVIDLKERGVIGPAVINMSLAGPLPSALEERVIDEAIGAGIVLVASAANAGEAQMGWPGAYPRMISAGAVGWTEQFRPGSASSPNIGFWWTRDVGMDPDPSDRLAQAEEAYVPFFSSRALLGLPPPFTQELDVLAPGDYIVAPFGFGPKAGFIFFGGTSASAPLVAGVAALMLEKNPGLGQAEVESIMKSTAIPMSGDDSRPGVVFPGFGEIAPVWDTDCRGRPCDPVGAGLLQADEALDATP